MTDVEIMWHSVEPYRKSTNEERKSALPFLADALEDNGDPLAATVRWMVEHDHFPCGLSWWDADRVGVGPDDLDPSDIPGRVFDALEGGRDYPGYGQTTRAVYYKSFRECVEALDKALRKTGEL